MYKRQIEDAPDPEPEDPQAKRPGAWIEEALAARDPDPPPVDETAIEPAPEAARTSPPEGRKIIGRYSFGGAQYALFEDGTIETETKSGVARFASLAELRARIAGEPKA